MLCLGRAVDESIEITVPPSTEHQVIKVVVCAVRYGRDVRLGIEADKNIKILRSELKERDNATQDR